MDVAGGSRREIKVSRTSVIRMSREAKLITSNTEDSTHDSRLNLLRSGFRNAGGRRFRSR
jgi:hypothetical protein